jgi:hypothetical protein
MLESSKKIRTKEIDESDGSKRRLSCLLLIKKCIVEVTKIMEHVNSKELPLIQIVRTHQRNTEKKSDRALEVSRDRIIGKISTGL